MISSLRTGIGYDVHSYGLNRDLILGGVNIPYKYGLVGHSDADVLIHAIMDALLGAAALDDIGTHFPDSSEKFAGIASTTLLKKVYALISDQGYEIINIDTVVMCQEPKIMPFASKMRENIASILSLSSSCVGIKATTTESLGFVGRKEGIAAQSVALMYKK